MCPTIAHGEQGQPIVAQQQRRSHFGGKLAAFGRKGEAFEDRALAAMGPGRHRLAGGRKATTITNVICNENKLTAHDTTFRVCW